MHALFEHAISLPSLSKAEESKLGRILVETAILLSMHNHTDAAKILRVAAHAYNVIGARWHIQPVSPVWY